MDDFEFDFDQLDQLLNFLSPPTLQEKNSSISLQTQSCNDIDSHQKNKSITTTITTTTIFDDDQLLNFLSSPPPSPRPPLTSTLQKEDDSSISLQTQSLNDLDSHQKNEPIITTTATTIFDDDQLLNFLSSPPPSPPPPLTSTLQRKDDSSISFQTQSSNDLDSHQKDEPISTTTTIVDDYQVQDPMKEKEVEGKKKKKKKNVLRRDVERQRRRDMAKLYQRLRLLIPSKYLMGKRAISDHLEEIVDYVKDLRRDIEDLERKREGLKEKKNITAPSSSSSSMKLSDDEDRIVVKYSCNEEVEISVKGGISLSKVVKVVMKEGLIVNSCVSSMVDQSLLHIIQSKVNIGGDIDLAMLRSKLLSLSSP